MTPTPKSVLLVLNVQISVVMTQHIKQRFILNIICEMNVMRWVWSVKNAKALFNRDQTLGITIASTLMIMKQNGYVPNALSWLIRESLVQSVYKKYSPLGTKNTAMVWWSVSRNPSHIKKTKWVTYKGLVALLVKNAAKKDLMSTAEAKMVNFETLSTTAKMKNITYL